MTKTQQKLVTDNIGFALDYAKNYAPNLSGSVEIDDVRQEALMGMCDAAVRFDPDNGAKFITYAVWRIRARINRCLDHSTTVRLPYTRALKVVECEECGHHYKAAMLFFTCPKCDHVMERFPIAIMRGQCMDYLSADVPPPDRDAWTGIDRRLCESLLSVLEGRDRKIFDLMYFEGLTMKATGAKLGVSKERVRQCHNKAMARVRKRAGHRLVA